MRQSLTRQLNTFRIDRLVDLDSQSTGSGTSVSFSGFPSNTKQIIIVFGNVSQDGAGDIEVTIGDDGGLEATGYTSTGMLISTSVSQASSSTTAFVVHVNGAAAVLNGSMILERFDSTAWRSRHTMSRDTTSSCFGGGTKTLTGGPLTQLRVAVSTGNFDGGNVNVMYQ